ncbi:MAG: hypothetical protein AB7D06_03735 [Pedobacter sp.]
MKVLILNDCSDKKTAVSDPLRGICDGIAAPHEIEWVNIGSLTIQPCMRCLKCYPCGECLLPEDDAHKIGRMLFAADALVIGLNASMNRLRFRFKMLLQRCMASIVFQDHEGKLCPWRKGRVAVVAGMESSERMVAGSPGRSGIVPPLLNQVLESGGFHVIGNVTGYSSEFSVSGMLPIEQARALGCSLSCIMSV